MNFSSLFVVNNLSSSIDLWTFTRLLDKFMEKPQIGEKNDKKGNVGKIDRN